MKTTSPPPSPLPPAVDLDGLLRRLHLPTIRRLYTEFENRAEAEEMSYRDYLALLVAEEVAHRAETRIQRANQLGWTAALALHLDRSPSRLSTASPTARGTGLPSPASCG